MLVHHGHSVNSGHYLCYVKASNGMWHCCDDHSVTNCSERGVLEQRAYILFYVRRQPRYAVPPSSLVASAAKATKAQLLKDSASAAVAAEGPAAKKQKVEKGGASEADGKAAAVIKPLDLMLANLRESAAEKAASSKASSASTSGQAAPADGVQLRSTSAKLAAQAKLAAIEAEASPQPSTGTPQPEFEIIRYDLKPTIATPNANDSIHVAACQHVRVA